MPLWMTTFRRDGDMQWYSGRMHEAETAEEAVMLDWDCVSDGLRKQVVEYRVIEINKMSTVDFPLVDGANAEVVELTKTRFKTKLLAAATPDPEVVETMEKRIAEWENLVLDESGERRLKYYRDKLEFEKEVIEYHKTHKTSQEAWGTNRDGVVGDGY